MKLLVCELFQLIHDAEDAVWVYQSTRQASALVEDEVDVHVVEDVLLQFRVQLLLHFVLLRYRIELRQAHLRHVSHAIIDVCRGRTGHIQDRKCGLLLWFEVVGHSDDFDRFAGQIERSAIVLVLPVASGRTAFPGHVYF